MTNTKIVILAAGKGTRLASLGFDLPKPLVPIHGKPMIAFLIDAVRESGVDDQPIVVVSPAYKDVFVQALGEKVCQFVVQKEQLGTGHAVASAQEAFAEVEQVLVLYGDHPTLKAETIKRLAEEHQSSGAILTMMTVRFPDFEDWRQWFTNFSRIIRDANGNIIRDVQWKDASEQELKITEVNPCYLVFRRDWLVEHLSKLTTNNAQKEYYLTDLVQMAFSERQVIHSVVIDNAIEAIGINTPEQYKAAEEVLK